MRLHIFIPVFFISGFLLAQNNWSLKNSGLNENLQSIFFLNENLGWCSTAFGKVIKTTDGGNTWSVRQTNTTAPLNAIKFLDANNGWIAADQGIILKTTNGGETWINVNTGNTRWQGSLFFLNDKIGWFAGFRLLKTVDGGLTWETIELPSTFTAVHFLTELIGWGCSYNGSVYKTTDGGNTWSLTTAGNTTLQKIHFFDLNNGVVCGLGGSVYKTSDGGATWSSKNTLQTDWGGMSFTNNNTGWLSGSNGKLLKTTNGGESWTEFYVNTPSILRSIFFINENLGWVVGDDGIIYKYQSSAIESKLKVITPNGGESWASGTTQQIKWNSRDNSESIKIEYSTDNGYNWYLISANVPSNPQSNSTAISGTYNWNIPNTISENCLVRISNPSNSSINDISDTTFRITEISTNNNILELIQPNGGEVLEANTNYKIKYKIISHEIVGMTLQMQVTYNGGVDWHTIKDYSFNSLSDLPVDWIADYDWLVPNNQSSNCKIRIVKTSNGSQILDNSENTFTITQPRPLKLISPNGGEYWINGSTHKIEWLSNEVESINIEYSTNLGVSWINIASNVSTSMGHYNWIVPNTISENCLVRINNTNNNLVNDTSDAKFSIISHPPLMLQYPNGGEVLLINTIKKIRWYLYPCDRNINVKIEYSTNNGTSWSVISELVPTNINNQPSLMEGSFSWQIPNTASSTCKVRITSLETNTVKAESEAVFIIKQHEPIVVITPNGGEIWEPWTLKNIELSGVSNGEDIDVAFSSNNGVTWEVVIQNFHDYPLEMLVPATPSNQCKIKINLSNQPELVDESDNTFSITTPLNKILITSPEGVEEYIIGAQRSIQWHSYMIEKVNIEYSTNSGQAWILLESNYPSSLGYGSYNWIIPNTPSKYCKVRVRDAANPNEFDESEGLFSILSPTSTELLLEHPAEGDKWEIGSTQVISWNLTLPSIKLEISTNGGNSWALITNNYSHEFFEYLVPNTPSTNCMIRITNVENPSMCDTSGVFSIVSETTNRELTVVYPNGGEILDVGSTVQIAWHAYQNGNFVLQYSTNNGVNWLPIAEASNTVNESYSWLVPNTPSANCKIRVMNKFDVTICDTSNGVFSIIDPTEVELKISIPTKFLLNQNYPNPFNPTTDICFDVPTQSYVELKIYDVLGKEVSTLTSSMHSPGRYSYSFDAADLPSGIYFYHISAGVFQQTKKMLLIK